MFSWSRSSASPSSSSYPASRTSATASPSLIAAVAPRGFSRQEHIASYLNDPTLKPSTRRVSTKDNSTYDTVFQTKSGHALIIRVHLPPDVGYPPASVHPPAMTLVGVSATHPWIDSRMRVVGYQHIASDAIWLASGLKLGQAVNAVVQHLQLNPPVVLKITDESLKRIQDSVVRQNQQQHSNSTSNGPMQQGSHHKQPIQPQTHQTNCRIREVPPDYDTLLMLFDDETNASSAPLPLIPSSFSELQTMERSALEAIFNDEMKLLAFIDNMSDVVTFNTLKQSLLDGNIQAAEASLKKEGEFQALHAEVKSLQESLRQKVGQFKALESRRNELCAPPDKQIVIRQLQKAKREAFDESEELANSWVDGNDLNVDEFVDKFLEKRTVQHVRAAKIERLGSIM